ncbi:MAG: ArsB/NhaD family transporter [Oscillatoriales cyanobacterium SM2_2_1]|nr:ArsB/NhaD family transporter [Oscillatoriales cyanobacterium SM2_2_1]
MVDTWQSGFAIAVFVTTVFLLMTEWLHMAIIALLGAMILVFANIMSLPEAISYIGNSHGTLALFFGVMVMVRAFEPTRIFEYLATQMVILADGRGDRLVIGVALLTTFFSAVLPNATTVVLLAPLLPPLSLELGIDFAPLIILMVLTANSAGLLTLIGDPVTYILGESLRINFLDYLLRCGFSGVLAVGIVLITAPWLFRNTWQIRMPNLEKLPLPRLNHPRILLVGGLITLFVLVFFVIGENLPYPVSPASVALMGATLALLLSHHSKVDTVPHILSDVDWSTLIFFMSFFVITGSLERTGVITSLSNILAQLLGQNILAGSVLLLWVSGSLSALVPNIPLMVAMVPLLRDYAVAANLMTAAAPTVPVAVLPLFYGLLYGVSLGGNGSLIGASANIVAAGISEQHGRRISFNTFLRYGLPLTILQLVATSIYLLFQFWLSQTPT